MMESRDYWCLMIKKDNTNQISVICMFNQQRFPDDQKIGKFKVVYR